MPSIEENKKHWGRGYHWPDNGHEWSVGSGGTPYVWHGIIMPRLSGFLPAANILEIAPGHGRFTKYLLELGHVTAIDVADECTRYCKSKFRSQRWRGRAKFYTNDGLTLPMVPDNSIDLVFSWDSLVHAERDVIESYLKELFHKLRPGGSGLIHHSNLGNFPLDGPDPPANPGWRAPSMTWQLFQQFCRDAGLWCLSQEPRTFAQKQMIDCFSVFHRPLTPGPAPETVVLQNTDFYRETHNLKRISEMYRRP